MRNTDLFIYRWDSSIAGSSSVVAKKIVELKNWDSDD